MNDEAIMRKFNLQKELESDINLTNERIEKTEQRNKEIEKQIEKKNKEIQVNILKKSRGEDAQSERIKRDLQERKNALRAVYDELKSKSRKDLKVGFSYSNVIGSKVL